MNPLDYVKHTGSKMQRRVEQYRSDLAKLHLQNLRPETAGKRARDLRATALADLNTLADEARKVASEGVRAGKVRTLGMKPPGLVTAEQDGAKAAQRTYYATLAQAALQSGDMQAYVNRARQLVRDGETEAAREFVNVAGVDRLRTASVKGARALELETMTQTEQLRRVDSDAHQTVLGRIDGSFGLPRHIEKAMEGAEREAKLQADDDTDEYAAPGARSSDVFTKWADSTAEAAKQTAIDAAGQADDTIERAG